MSKFIKVKEGVSGSVSHEVNQYQSLDDYISDQITRIDSDNPHLMKELCSFALLASDKLQPANPKLEKRLRAQIVSAGIMIYRMLESQADADKLDDLLGD